MFSRAAVASVLLTMAAQGLLAAPPAVLDKVPADAAVVVVVKDLKGFSTKVSNLGTRMNIPGVPADMLGDLTKKLHLGASGLDVNGSAAFSFSMPPKPKEGEAAPPYEKPMIILLPVADGTALLADLSPTAAENGISEVTNPDSGKPAYVSISGKYAIFSEDKAYLTHYLEGKDFLTKTLTPALTKSFEANDALVYANVEQFGPTVVQQLDMFAPMIKAQAVSRPGQSPAQAAMQRASMDLFFNGLRSVLTDGQAGLLTVRITDAGATVGFAGHFKPESALGKDLAAQKPIAGNPLQGLPAGSILFAGAGTLNGGLVTEYIGNFYDQLIADPQALEGKNAEDFKKYTELTKQMLALTRGARVVGFEPKAGQKGVLHGAAIVDVTDSAKMLELQKQMVQDNLYAVSTVGQPITLTGTQVAGPVIDGVAFTKNTMKYAVNPDQAGDPAAIAAMKMLNTMYGGDQVEVCIAALDPQHVMYVFCPDDALLAASVNAYKTKSLDLANTPDLKLAAKETLPNAVTVGYLPIDRIITLGKQIAKNGGELPTTAPAAPEADSVIMKDPVAPLTISLSAVAGNLTGEIHVPVSALVNISQNIQDARGPAEVSPMMVPPPQP